MAEDFRLEAMPFNLRWDNRRDKSSQLVTFADLDRCIHGHMRGLKCVKCPDQLSAGNVLVSDRFGLEKLETLPFKYSTLEP